MTNSIIVFLIAVFISSISQLLLKTSANKKYDFWLWEYLNLYVILGYGLFFLSTLLVVVAYQGLEFKYGAVIESTGFIMVMILSNIFLKERITFKKLLGNLIIIIGIVIFSL